MSNLELGDDVPIPTLPDEMISLDAVTALR
jgi:hypothetical protein